MSQIDREELALHAYCDGELGWWARRRVKVRLRRSAELRRELELIRSIGALAREEDAEIEVPDVWPSIASGLEAIDAQVEAEAVRAPSPEAGMIPAAWSWLTQGGWRPVGAAVAVAVAVLAVSLVLRPDPTLVVDEPSMVGAVRYLDTGGNPVMVIEGGGESTIIWLMDPPVDEA
jgi:hypothetical protein